nr:hypothetical protein [Tanacetum cinerariifolium]
MDPNSSIGKTCLGENIIELSSEKAEGHGDWNSAEYQDTTNSRGKKETKAFTFHKMKTEEANDRYVTPCFINGIEANGSKVVKKELIVALKGEIYFVKLIINPEEDDVEPGWFWEAKIDLNALADIGSDINVMPYCVYKELGREEVNNVNREITILNHSKAEHMGLLKDVMCQAAKSQYNTRLAQLLPRHIYSPCVVDWNVLNQMGCGKVIDEMLTIKLCVAGTNEEIFTSEAWTNAFNIHELIYSELCYEFYSTYEFDDVCADDELGLYHLKEIEEEGFDVYFQGGLLSDEHFNAREYSLSISRDQNGYANVAWLIARWMKRKGAGSQKDIMICRGQFVTKIAKRKNLLSDAVLNSLSAPICCRSLDTTTLRELIDSEGRVNPEAPEPGVSRVAIPRPPRASMQDLYERMGSMEVHQGAIERMSYRQSYQWEKYHRVFKHMYGVYDVPLQGAYNPFGHDLQQYDHIINSTHLKNSNNNQMMMSSVKMTQVGSVTACFGSSEEGTGQFLAPLPGRNSCAYDSNSNSFDCPRDSYNPPHPTYETYSGDSCGNDPQFGYDCPPQFPLNYEPEPGYTPNYNSYPHDSPSFPQQYPCCNDCGVTHEPYQCQPENHNYYDEQNFCYDSNSFGFDQIQTPQYTVNHPIFNAHNDFFNSQNELFTFQNKIIEQMTQLTSMCEMTCQIVQKKLEEKRIEEEQAATAQSRKLPEEFVFENSDAEIESFSPSPIPNKDSDSFMEEIDLFLTPDDPMPAHNRCLK